MRSAAETDTLIWAARVHLGLISAFHHSHHLPALFLESDRSILVCFFFFGLQKSSLVYMLREEELGRYCCISSLWLTLPLLRGQLHIRERITDNLSPSVSFFLNFQYHPSFRSDHSFLFKGEGVNFSVTRVTRWNCQNNDSLF